MSVDQATEAFFTASDKHQTWNTTMTTAARRPSAPYRNYCPTRKMWQYVVMQHAMPLAYARRVAAGRQRSSGNADTTAIRPRPLPLSTPLTAFLRSTQWPLLRALASIARSPPDTMPCAAAAERNELKLAKLLSRLELANETAAEEGKSRERRSDALPTGQQDPARRSTVGKGHKAQRRKQPADFSLDDDDNSSDSEGECKNQEREKKKKKKKKRARFGPSDDPSKSEGERSNPKQQKFVRFSRPRVPLHPKRKRSKRTPKQKTHTHSSSNDTSESEGERSNPKQQKLVRFSRPRVPLHPKRKHSKRTPKQKKHTRSSSNNTSESEGELSKRKVQQAAVEKEDARVNALVFDIDTVDSAISDRRYMMSGGLP